MLSIVNHMSVKDCGGNLEILWARTMSGARRGTCHSQCRACGSLPWRATKSIAQASRSPVTRINQIPVIWQKSELCQQQFLAINNNYWTDVFALYLNHGKYTFAFGVQDKQKRILKLFQKYCSDPSQNRDNLDMTFVNRRIQYSDQMLLECQPQYPRY